MFSEQKGGVSWEHIPKKTNEWSSRLELSLEPVDFVNLDLPPFAGLQERQHPATAHMILSQKNMCTPVLGNSPFDGSNRDWFSCFPNSISQVIPKTFWVFTLKI